MVKNGAKLHGAIFSVIVFTNVFSKRNKKQATKYHSIGIKNV